MHPLSLPSKTSGDGFASHDALEPIAIVGLATRFPQQATSTEKLWETLLQARSTWSAMPKERFNPDAFYHPDREHGGTFTATGGHYLSEDTALFDSSFFNITNKELSSMDPQQRLVLENVYHALENAGMPMANAVGSNTSVYVTGFNHDYLRILDSDPEVALRYKPTGTTNSILSNRVSWFFDFKGPSMTVDTACSSSLVALHLAVQSLRSRESNMAIVSGVSILESPNEFIGMSYTGLLGPQGRSFSFDSRAEGYARGEGVGTVVVKPLHAAIRDGDTIRAVIRETGVNQDGRTPGITVPSGDAQERLIREVYWRAGLDLEHTRFVEAHGTGTRKGDPIEAGALARAFNCRRDTPLYVGAIKSTIGHLEGGSGVASLIKSIMVLESGIIPPNYDMQSVNPSIPAKEWNLAFPTENLPWPSSGLRRVSVNSFGIGGTNSHCILDDAHYYLRERQIKGNHRTVTTAPTTQEIENLIVGGKKSQGITSCIRATSEDGDASGGEDLFVDTPISEGGRESPQFSMSTATEWIDHPKLFLLSAFDEEGVTRNAAALASYLDNQINETTTDDHILNDLSFTLSKKRSLFPWKSFVLASSVKELSWNLSELNFIKPSRTATPELHFVFTGQGAQYQLMGRELMAYAVFQESVEDASDYIRRLGSPWSLLDELLTERDSPRVHLPEIAQPLCTVLQIALLDLLASWNIFPARVTGHSAGEIAAAYCAGKISREAGWKAAYYRGYVSSKLLSANGTMMAVGLSASELEGYIAQVRSTSPGELLVACHNSPKNNTVSGDEAMVDSLKSLLDADGVFVRKLQVQNAYHSAHMKTVAAEYLSLMGTLPHGKRLVAPHKVSMFSSVTGEVIKEERLDSQYWVDNMISPVRFSSGLQSMVFETDSGSGQTGSDRLCLIVEIGPHSTLQSAIKETLAARDAELNFKYLSVLKRTERSLSTLLTTAGTLASSGLAVDFHRVNRAIESGKVRRSKLLVNLPSYSFKHSEKVLFEGRLTKNLRARKHPRHDLFGAPATDWNSLAPRWRHFFRLHENPWLRDHMVTGNCIYPGVGYLIMAIEASKQLAGDMKITGIELRRVHIKRAMIIPDSKEGVEVSLSMAVVEDPDSGSRTWRRFHITSYNASSEDWTEHCTGLITVNHEASPDLVDNGRAAEEENRQWKADFADAKEVCNQPINFKASYNNLEASGLNFGTLFRNLDEVRGSGRGIGKIIGSVTVPNIKDSMPKQYMHSHLIHPATMDSMIHMMIAALQDLTGRSSLDRVRLPTFIRNAWISADLNAATSHKFTGHASVGETQSDKLEGQIYMLDEGSNAPCVRMNGIELTPLESGVAENNERKLCSAIQYKPDIHFLESHAACEMTPLANTDEADDLHWVKRLQLATMIYVTDALDECKNIDVKGLDSHLQRYLDWMKHFKEKLIQNEIIHLPYTEFQKAIRDETLKETISQELEAHSAECAITVRMGQNISRVLKGEANPLDLMFGQDSVMEQVYREGLEIFNLPQHLRNHLSLIRHQHSELKILEIGGGTGSLTAEVLGILSPDPTKSKGNISSYTFTDISSGFFDKAKERFQSWSDIFKFQAFNIEHNPVEQGLEAGTYDLIVAGNVIHATKDLHDALKNLRSLLKPGGQLIMQEGIRQDFLWYPLVFGQLPGWWLGDEPCRQWCPYIRTEEWNGYLIEAGFSGVDIEYPSSNNPDLTWQSILVSSNPPAAQDLPVTSALILTTLESSVEILSLQQTLKKIGYGHVDAIHPSKLAGYALANVHCMSTIDLECQYLTEMNEAQFHDLKGLLTEIENLLWITTQPETNPHLSMIMGLLRTVRWERDSDDSNIITLTVPQQEFYGSNQAQFLSDISKIIKHQFWNNSKVDRHAEYLLQNGIIHIGRLDEWSAGDQFLGIRSSKLYPKTQRLDKIDYPIEAQRAVSGDSEVYWTADLQHENMLADDEVEIEVRAAGLSSNASGYLSTEAAGVVTQIGSKVESILPGDRVAYISPLSKGGRCRTHERVTQSLITQIPSDMSFEIAAQLASVYATSVHGILNCAALTADDTILIHNGALAVSQAAIQCAQMSGATILTTVGTIEDRDLLVSEYNIPVDHIFSNKDLAFAKSVMRCTNGSGVDAVFNTMTGEALRETLSCLAPHGTFVDVAQNEVRVDTTTELASLSQNVSIHKVNMLSMADTRPKTARSRLHESFGLYTDRKIGQIRKSVVLSFAQIQEGIQGVQSGKYAKVVFIPSPADMISVAPKPITAYQFDSDATYVLAGGYGGLGRNLARWMATRGARNLLMLSRSSASSADKRETVIDLEKIGCKVVDLVCDISDLSTLSALSDGRLSHLPPIKGCIQASMVLRDGSFAGMSFEDWRVATKPKVQGSWNLHKVLPEDMDFFVMLSSVAGILGNRGQANYAAGNTFQDALVAYRLSQGMNASSINLGSVSNIGWVAENRNSMRTHTATLFEMLREEEVQAAVEFLIDPRLKDRDNVNPCSQLVLGLPTAEMCRQNGVPAPTYLEYSMFTHLRGTAMTKDSGALEQKSVSTSSLLAAASGFEAAVTVATNGLVEKLSSLLATPASEIDAHRFGFGGIDSLVAMEFRYWIVKELKADVSLLDIIGSENIKVLGVKIAERSRLIGGTT